MTSSAPLDAETRSPRLDGVRSIAILPEVLHHGELPSARPRPSPCCAPLVELGFMGMKLFFALSGGRITGTLLHIGSGGLAASRIERASLFKAAATAVIGLGTEQPVETPSDADATRCPGYFDRRTAIT